MNRLTNTSVDSRNSGAVRLFCDTQTALKKLKKYEDTGIEPEEIKKCPNCGYNFIVCAMESSLCCPNCLKEIEE